MLHQPRVRDCIEKASNSIACQRDNEVSDRIRRCRSALSAWKRTNNTNAKDNITQIHVALEREQCATRTCFQH